jgi:predicted PolB exonuclease-like 3'-5' exonuclease
MTNKIYIDIETIPDQRDGAIDRIKETLSPPGTLKKAESIAAWHKDKAPLAAEEKYLKTSLDGLYGQILCIGIAVDDNEPICLTGTESMMLAGMYAVIEKGVAPLIIGHNILKFDLPFIKHRSIINSVHPTVLMPDSRFNNSDAYDTMQGWAGFNNYVSLDNLCFAFGIESPKDGIDGSQVWEYVQAGKEQVVFEYCKRDVAATREVFKRLTFSQ